MASDDDLFDIGLGFDLFDSDFLSLSSLEPLPDFSAFDCEGTDIDSLIQALEETEKFNAAAADNSSLFVTNSHHHHSINSITNHDLQQKLCKATKTSAASAVPTPNAAVANVATLLNPLKNEKTFKFRKNVKKRKGGGISLLAKPSKVVTSANNDYKRKGKSISPTRFATYFYEDHNYCPINAVTVATTATATITNENDATQHLNNSMKCKNSLTNNLVTESNKSSLLALDTLNYLDEFDSISLEIESEVIMNFDVDCSNAVNDCCESVLSSNDDLNKESAFNSESESLIGSSANEINLDILDDIDKERSESTCELRNNAKPTKVYRRRHLSTRSSVCSSRSSSVSSSCSSCSCSSDSTSRCRSRSRSPNQSSSGSRSRSVSCGDNRKNAKFRRRRSWRNEGSFSTNPYVKRGDSCAEDRKNWYYDRRKECIKEVEERRIVYVGNIPEGTTKTDLRYWFAKFGPITQVSVHFRDYGNNYAFVTFQRRSDAYEAVQRGNDDKRHPVFDLSFGGRRNFCKNRYEDLGNGRE
ncbi:protein SON-like isoform X2 [Dinothrombium tinctorium]|uniref:Protein SON-like isoform X2 n=1 Tax=Dinothrombium tinctorium TaxID=1965070 RepID=A0A3S3Q6V1_9ACAR|nr:protein SON-like isoform X2 [Dinothrombium tinctorium]